MAESRSAIKRVLAADPRPLAGQSEMVTLRGIDEVEFELAVDGYQFPANLKGSYDSNWVTLRGNVRHPKGNWSFKTPCATTSFVPGFADWLEAVHENEEAEDFIFGETVITFQFSSLPIPTISVELIWEAAPPWLRPDDKGRRMAVLRFRRGDNDLLAAAAAWRVEVRKVPPRHPPVE